MQIMRSLIAMLATFTVAGCSDVVTTQFATLDEAKAQRAFERGWLPPIMPNSAKRIVEKNNLNLNTGRGSFDYDLSERSGYVSRLHKAGASLHGQQNVDVLKLATNGSRWEIELNRASGRARYKIKPL